MQLRVERDEFAALLRVERDEFAALRVERDEFATLLQAAEQQLDVEECDRANERDVAARVQGALEQQLAY